MTPETRQLLTEIDAYCAASGIAPSTLTTRALNDGKTYDRLSNGGRCWPETASKIRAYMNAHPPAASPPGAHRTPGVAAGVPPAPGRVCPDDVPSDSDPVRADHRRPDQRRVA